MGSHPYMWSKPLSVYLPWISTAHTLPLSMLVPTIILNKIVH